MSASPQLQIILDALRASGRRPRQSGDQWIVRCPAHDDADASLSISDGDIGVVAHCHAGCSFGDIALATGVPQSDWFYGGRPGGKAARSPLAVYDYRGGVQKHRYAGKAFRWYVEGKTGPRVLNGRSPHNMLFGEELLASDPSSPVIVAEGEKGALALRRLLARESVPMVAVSSAGGAKWRPTPRVIRLFERRRVIIWPDADESGWALGRHLAQALDGVASAVEAIVIPDVRQGFDPADWSGTWRELQQHVYGPEAIPAVAAGRAERFVQVARGCDDLVGLTPLAEQVYWRLVFHLDGGIVRAVQVTPRSLAVSIAGSDVPPQTLSNYSRVLGDLERRGLISRAGDWVYVRRGSRFLPLKGDAAKAGQKFLKRLPAGIQAALIADEPSLAPSRVLVGKTAPSAESNEVRGTQRHQQDPPTKGDRNEKSIRRGCLEETRGLSCSEQAEPSANSDLWADTLPGSTEGSAHGSAHGSDHGSDHGVPPVDTLDTSDCPVCGRDSCAGCPTTVAADQRWRSPVESVC